MFRRCKGEGASISVINVYMEEIAEGNKRLRRQMFSRITRETGIPALPTARLCFRIQLRPEKSSGSGSGSDPDQNFQNNI